MKRIKEFIGIILINCVFILPIIGFILLFLFARLHLFIAIVTVLLVIAFPNINYQLHKGNSIPYKTMEEYTKLLKDYMFSNQCIDMLQNKYIQLYFNNYGYGDIIRILNRKNNKMYEIRLIEKETAKLFTVWGIIQMYFNEKITFNGLNAWVNLMDNIQIKQVKTLV